MADAARGLPRRAGRGADGEGRGALGRLRAGGLLTIARPDCSLARAEWLVESAQHVLAIVFALNRVHQPTAKRLGERVERLAIKPERLAERIDAALVEADPRTALRLMTELQLDAPAAG